MKDDQKEIKEKRDFIHALIVKESSKIDLDKAVKLLRKIISENN